jgi:hypothetical protein
MFDMNEQQFQAEVMDELRQREEMDQQDQRQAMIEERRRQDRETLKRIGFYKEFK